MEPSHTSWIDTLFTQPLFPIMSSLVPLNFARSILNEVEVHEKSSEAASWLATLKKLIQDAKAFAADDMQKDQTDTRRATSPGKARRGKSKKVKRDRKRKSRSRSSSANRSDSEEARCESNRYGMLVVKLPQVAGFSTEMTAKFSKELRYMSDFLQAFPAVQQVSQSSRRG